MCHTQKTARYIKWQGKMKTKAIVQSAPLQSCCRRLREYSSKTIASLLQNSAGTAGPNPAVHYSTGIAFHYLTQFYPPAPIFTEKECPDLSGKVCCWPNPHGQRASNCRADCPRSSLSQVGTPGSGLSSQRSPTRRTAKFMSLAALPIRDQKLSKPLKPHPHRQPAKWSSSS